MACDEARVASARLAIGWQLAIEFTAHQVQVRYLIASALRHLPPELRATLPRNLEFCNL